MVAPKTINTGRKARSRILALKTVKTVRAGSIRRKRSTGQEDDEKERAANSKKRNKKSEKSWMIRRNDITGWSF
jgi:hypothetical protein